MNKIQKFVVMEGLDGAGKSTQINLLKDYFNEHSIDFRYIHFPRTDTSSPVYGEMVADFLKGDYGDLNTVNPFLVALLYAGDRNNAKDTIREWLDKGDLVVLDRYVYSNMAFQGAKLQDPDQRQKLIRWIHHLEYEYFKIPKPTLSIFLHMQFDFVSKRLKDARKGEDRNYLQGKEDIHESSMEFQKNVEDVYLQLIRENDDFHLIDCFDKNNNTLSPDFIHQKIVHLLIEKEII
jgi:dTMP kinase